MEQDTFTKYNKLICDLYDCHALSDLKERLFEPLRELMHCSFLTLTPAEDTSFAGAEPSIFFTDSTAPSLQIALTCQAQTFGLLTLYRDRQENSFSEEDRFLLRALALHLGHVLYRFYTDTTDGRAQKAASLAQTCHLTAREAQILALIFKYQNNSEIAETLSITESTTQKHLQSIFRKTGAATRWDLLRFLQH